MSFLVTELEIQTVNRFPSLRAREVVRLLERGPLYYTIKRQRGSHKHFASENYPDVLFSYHDGKSLAPGELRKLLVGIVGLSEEDALRLIDGNLS